MAAALYTADILRLATSIPHLGRLERADASVARRSPVCGSEVAVDICLDDTGRLSALGQEVKACALGQASAALMGRFAPGKSIVELIDARDALAAFLAGERDNPGPCPGLDIFAPAIPHKARHASIRLAFEAVAEAAAEASAKIEARA